MALVPSIVVIFSYFIVSIWSETCITPTSLEGECITITLCQPLNEAYVKLNNNSEIASLIRRSQCGFSETEPKVCCPKGDVTRPFVLPKRPVTTESVIPIFQNRFGEDEKDKCGIQYSANRIFDGTITDLNEFPWMALLAYQTEKGVGLACGGVLIGKRHVLTAAHCTTGSAMKKLGKLVAVRLGEYDTKSTLDCDSDYIDDYCAPPPLDIFVDSVRWHPDYKPDTANRYHDIAVIKLASEVKFNEFVQPICLPTAAQSDILSKIGSRLEICGWGQTETKASSTIKLKAKVPVISFDECKSPYEASGIQIGETQVCAGGGKQDSCKGDSGGPLMYEDKADPTETRWYAVGIISFGAEPCAKIGVPAVYTKTYSYLTWVQEMMQL